MAMEKTTGIIVEVTRKSTGRVRLGRISVRRYNILSSTAKLAKDMTMALWDVKDLTTTAMTRTGLGSVAASM